MEGIGRPRVEPSFRHALVDQMVAITDATSITGAHWLRDRTGRMFGPSTGTNIIGALMLGDTMAQRGECGTARRGAVVTLACDDGERYRSTIYDSGWLVEAGIDFATWQGLLGTLGRERFPQALLARAGMAD